MGAFWMTEDEDRFFEKLVRLYIASRDLMDGTASPIKASDRWRRCRVWRLARCNQAPWYRLRSAERRRAIGKRQQSGGGTSARDCGAVPESGSSTSDTSNVLQP